MEKVFVVMNLDSKFIGVYSSREKAQNVVDRLENEFLGYELTIEETPVNDFSMFDPI